MENTKNAVATTGGGKREPTIDPVKKQGILTVLTRKERDAARLWHQKWGFYTHLREIQEEEAQKLGMTLDEYKSGVNSVNCQPDPAKYPVVVEPSPKPLPRTSSGTVGHRANCTLERYGRLVKTSRDYPPRPPLPPSQVYDPYKQTIIFLGIDVGDPISYKLPPNNLEVTDDMLARPLRMEVSAFSLENFTSLK